MGKASEICVVTGGRGFLAKAVVQKLLEENKFVVRIADLAPNMSLAEEELTSELGNALRTGRVQYISCDIRKKEQVVDALRGAAVVFHMAAPDISTNNFKLHFDVSVTGTRNVIEVCRECGVCKLVYTSSPSIVFDGVHPVVNADESIPICDKFNDYYCDAKAHGEALVLDANSDRLLTCSIRPSGIFGPGDRLTVPTFAMSARAGKLKFILGDGKNMSDWTYVENVAHAHLCAERALSASSPLAAGKAFFITNDEPIPFWDFLMRIITGLGYPKPKANIPAPLVLTIAEAYDSLVKTLGLKPAVNFNPVRLRLVTVTRTFNCSRAKELLGYTPIVTLDEGIRRTIASYPDLRADAPDHHGEIQPTSMMHASLGSGTVANLLLWKDGKHSAACFFALLTFLYLFYNSGTTLVSTLTYNLCMVLIATFVLNFLPDPLFNVSLPNLPPSLFEVSEQSAAAAAMEVCRHWNCGVAMLDRIMVQRDFRLFFKIMFSLRVMKFFGQYSFQSLLFMALFVAFSVPYLYEQNEEEFEKLHVLAVKTFQSYSELVISKVPENIWGRLETKKMQ